MEGSKKKLGFGLMRLPRKGVAIDLKEFERMTDHFLENGFTYFDTAHVYPGSEEAARKALVQRHPRESYTLASKLFAASAISEKVAKKQLQTSLERLGTDYLDYYLLHTLMNSNYQKYERFHLWDFLQEQKEKGVIRHAGFSFHAGPDLLDELLTQHPEVDFVQLQINYADWENPSVTSRANYEVARRHNKPVVIMEPVKGGKLANPTGEILEAFRSAEPDMSPASWAIRFAASLDGVLAVLSGMSNLDQMKDNVSYMKEFRRLNEEEQQVIREVQRLMGRDRSIQCTACSYCTKGCPKQIPIPQIFAAVNKRDTAGRHEEAQEDYDRAVEGRGCASDCVHCLQCEDACPQHLHITKLLEDAAQKFGR